jgi:DNA-binding MarR family transcriptional regulator
MTTVDDARARQGAGPTANPLADDLNWLLHRVGAGLGGALDHVTRRHGSGVRGYVVLKALAGSPPLTQLALGQQLGLDKTAVTAVLDALEAQGWVTRLPAPGDRRARIAEVTAAGRAWVERVAREVEAAEADVLADLSPDQREQLRQLLASLAFGRSASAHPPAGSCL